MIRTANLSFSYDAKRTITFPGFSLNRGEHCLLLGESGSGKTTLLHLLGGLLRGYSGNLQMNGTELSTLSESEMDAFRGKNIGFIFQKNHLISALSVEQNLFMAPYLAGLRVDETRAKEVLGILGIEEKSKSAVTEISQGQAQRVAIARAILNQPSIILADEPTSALDDRSCERVINLLLQVANSQQSTLVVATHDQRLKNKIRNQILLEA
jgi:ABC-type lipoprotein export system ATPase subunit